MVLPVIVLLIVGIAVHQVFWIHSFYNSRFQNDHGSVCLNFGFELDVTFVQILWYSLEMAAADCYILYLILLVVLPSFEKGI